MKNLIKKIGRGIAPLVLSGALAVVGCAGINPKIDFKISQEGRCISSFEDSGEYGKTHTFCRIPKTNYSFHFVDKGRSGNADLGEYDSLFYNNFGLKMRVVKQLNLTGDNFRAGDEDNDQILNGKEFISALQDKYGKDTTGYELRGHDVKLLRK